jgi:hypothetical protein
MLVDFKFYVISLDAKHGVYPNFQIELSGGVMRDFVVAALCFE